MKYVIYMLLLIGIGFSGCTDDEVFEELNYSYYDPAYQGPNPISIVSTEYFQHFEYDSNGSLIAIIDRAEIFLSFDESVLPSANSNYFLSLDGAFGVGANQDGNVVIIRDVNTSTSDYCSEVRFLDAVHNPVHSYNMCYTIEY